MASQEAVKPTAGKAQEFYVRTRIFPIMHLVAIRREVFERHPFVAASLYDAFGESKNRALAECNHKETL